MEQNCINIEQNRKKYEYRKENNKTEKKKEQNRTFKNVYLRVQK